MCVGERERERVRACVCVCQYVMLRVGGGSRERLAYYKDARLDKKQNNLKQTGNTPHTPKIKQSIFSSSAYSTRNKYLGLIIPHQFFFFFFFLDRSHLLSELPRVDLQ